MVLKRINNFKLFLEKLDNIKAYGEDYTGLEFLLVYNDVDCLVPDMIYQNDSALSGHWLDTQEVIDLATKMWGDKLRKNYKIRVWSYKLRSLNNDNTVSGTPDMQWSIKIISDSPLEFSN
jgi:hypothetical protein